MPRTDSPTEFTPLVCKPKWSFGDCCKPNKIRRCLKRFSVCLFTDWPCETVKCIINTTEVTREADEVPLQQQQAARQRPVARQQQTEGQQGDAERQLQDETERPRCCTTSNTLWLMLAVLRVLFIIAGTSVQLVMCFRRDSINTDFKYIANSSDHEKVLKCNDKLEIICGLLIPDGVVVLVAIWVHLGLKFERQCKFCEWEVLQTAMKADTAERLNALVEDVKTKLQEKSIIAWYTVIPLMYIVLSQVISVMYLVAFHLANKHVIIQPPLGKARLAGDVKYGIIVLSFFGFISLDLLYVCVMMRYAYRCQMIIYYLQIIKQDYLNNENNPEAVNNKNNPEAGGNEGNQPQDQKARSHQEMMKKVTKAQEYIKELNANSATTGFIILIATFQVVNCALTLLDKDKITSLQAAALSLRLILWGFLALFPFHKAGEVNRASKQLCKTGLDMHSSNNGMDIPKARMFGISVNPWLSYVVVILLLLTLMVGSKYKWYEHVHIL